MNPQINNGVNLSQITDLDVLNAMLAVQTTQLANTKAQNDLRMLQTQKGIDAINSRIAALTNVTIA